MPTGTMTHLKDYRPPDYCIPRTELEFDIQDAFVRVTATLSVELNGDSELGTPLVLNGEHLKLIEVSVDQALVPPSQYVQTDATLTFTPTTRAFTIQTVVEINPAANTALEGLYQSGRILCTQNEPEGFRRITYYLDRPDVMSTFTTTITADRDCYPYLLSNGNPISQEELDGNRHRCQWHDPFVKPSYLFALVAGDFARTADTFTTASGRTIDLQIYVDHGNEDKVAHTLASLKRAMRWDEAVFGLEYDLDLFMIVAVDAFNMGAMENKGLNVFNSACALANPDTSTDGDFERVESIVAHEYFHNWTGNRITLRDWFQLTLKEGLTVYRDSRYTAETDSAAIQRIEQVRGLRGSQFAEDAGPNAHPIQPQSYLEINNFYTATVYGKGAEIIRMLEVLLGKPGFRRGMDLYVDRHDGQAITTEDFVAAMEQANGVDLTQFRRWYHQAGTPTCSVSGEYDPAARTYALTVKQSCAPTSDGSPKEPLYFPMVMALLDAAGHDMPLALAGEGSAQAVTEQTLVIDRAEQTFRFAGVSEAPLPSLFRGLSAPVKVTTNYGRDDVVFLFAHDSDAFNRYDAGQRLGTECLIELTRSLQADADAEAVLPDDVLDAYATLLDPNAEDPSFNALALSLPSITVLNQELEECDFAATQRAIEMAKAAIARRHEAAIKSCYDAYAFDPARDVAEAAGRRRLRNVCLDYLSYLDDGAIPLASQQFAAADNMTDRMAALQTLCASASSERDDALAAFLDRYKRDFNVINKWFGVQASSIREAGLLDRMRVLLKHPLFDASNPNRFRSIYSAFAHALPEFHSASGEGYRFIADAIMEVDASNSMLSCGLGKGFAHYARMPEHNRSLMKQQLERIIKMPAISKGLEEVISKTLASVS